MPNHNIIKKTYNLLKKFCFFFFILLCPSKGVLLSTFNKVSVYLFCKFNKIFWLQFNKLYCKSNTDFSILINILMDKTFINVIATIMYYQLYIIKYFVKKF